MIYAARTYWIGKQLDRWNREDVGVLLDINEIPLKRYCIVVEEVRPEVQVLEVSVEQACQGETTGTNTVWELRRNCHLVTKSCGTLDLNLLNCSCEGNTVLLDGANVGRCVHDFCNCRSQLNVRRSAENCRWSANSSLTLESHCTSDDSSRVDGKIERVNAKTISSHVLTDIVVRRLDTETLRNDIGDIARVTKHRTLDCDTDRRIVVRARSWRDIDFVVRNLSNLEHAALRSVTTREVRDGEVCVQAEVDDGCDSTGVSRLDDRWCYTCRLERQDGSCAAYGHIERRCVDGVLDRSLEVLCRRGSRDARNELIRSRSRGNAGKCDGVDAIEDGFNVTGSGDTAEGDSAGLFDIASCDDRTASRIQVLECNSCGCDRSANVQMTKQTSCIDSCREVDC